MGGQVFYKEPITLSVTSNVSIYIRIIVLIMVSQTDNNFPPEYIMKDNPKWLISDLWDIDIEFFSYCTSEHQPRNPHSSRL